MLDVIDASNGIDEKSLLDMGKATLVTGPAAKATDLIDLLSLCKDYGINMLGSIYIDPEAIS